MSFGKSWKDSSVVMTAPVPYTKYSVEVLRCRCNLKVQRYLLHQKISENLMWRFLEISLAAKALAFLHVDNTLYILLDSAVDRDKERHSMTY